MTWSTARAREGSPDGEFNLAGPSPAPERPEIPERDVAPAAPASDAPATGTRRRLEHIDAMRPIKQAAVVSTHALIFFAPLASSVTVVGLIMLTRFSRDAFLFVSACMLAYSYKDAAKVKLGHYFQRRLLSVGLPYLAWTVIYAVFTRAAPVSGFPFYSLHGSALLSSSGLHYFLHLFLTGYYHLYYLIVIMEFYVLFPLLLALARRWPRWHVAMVVVAALWQLAYGVLLATHAFGFRISGTDQSRWVFSYSIYLISGLVVALHLEDVHDWICRHARLILSLTVAFAGLAEALNYLEHYRSLPAYLRTGNFVFSAAIVPFNVGAILSIYLLGVHLVSAKRSVRTRAAVQSGSDNSYGVYLSQMLWIPLLVRLRDHFSIHLAWPIAAPLALVIVYFAGFFFTAVVARTPLARAVTGRSRASWSSLWPRWNPTPEVLHADTGAGPLEVASD
jgi:peptidoglycan/LPS O-acetylase OafA/YrhL